MLSTILAQYLNEMLMVNVQYGIKLLNSKMCKSFTVTVSDMSCSPAYVFADLFVTHRVFKILPSVYTPLVNGDINDTLFYIFPNRCCCRTT